MHELSMNQHPSYSLSLMSITAIESFTIQVLSDRLWFTPINAGEPLHFKVWEKSVEK